METIDDDSFRLHWDEADDDDEPYYLIYKDGDFFKGSVTNQLTCDGQDHGQYNITIATVDFACNMSDPTYNFSFDF